MQHRHRVMPLRRHHIGIPLTVFAWTFIMLQPAVFLDKDGTLLDDVPYNIDPALMRLAPGAREALALLGASPFALFVISNQPGVALGMFARSALKDVEAQLHRWFAECGATLSGAYWCPHHPDGTVPPYNVGCDCRSPARACCCARRARTASTSRTAGSSAIFSTTWKPATAPAAAPCCSTMATRPNGSKVLCACRSRAADLHAAAQLILRDDGASRTAPLNAEATR